MAGIFDTGIFDTGIFDHKSDIIVPSGTIALSAFAPEIRASKSITVPFAIITILAGVPIIRTGIQGARRYVHWNASNNNANVTTGANNISINNSSRRVS